MVLLSSSSDTSLRPSKQRVSRKVTTLTPSQLARKRACDRESQRAIRARTKEYISRLERDLEELRSRQNLDQTVQELERQNQALRNELELFRNNMNVITASSPYTSPTTLPLLHNVTSSQQRSMLGAASAYKDDSAIGSDCIPSTPNSFSAPGDQESLASNWEPLDNTIPCPLLTDIPSPWSSLGNYSAGVDNRDLYISTIYKGRFGLPIGGETC